MCKTVSLPCTYKDRERQEKKTKNWIDYTVRRQKKDFNQRIIFEKDKKLLAISDFKER